MPLPNWSKPRALQYGWVNEHYDASNGKHTAETARYLALRMSFEDLIRVADLKTGKSRFARGRSGVIAKVAQSTGANPASSRLAYEIALTARLIKGYSDTNKRGKANFKRIFDHLVEGTAVSGDEAKADAIFAAREAALADAEGKDLDKALGRHGVAPLPVKEVPIRFVRSAISK